MDKQRLKLVADTIRGLSIDGVEKANSGHPGLPLGMADVGAVLFNDFLNFNPKNPDWFNRDRFVLSGGHGSMLLYSLLHLYGYDISLDDLKQFRQWGSNTPGHPEYGLAPGVETTTGPLGQGISNAVGMAIAESHLASVYNREGHAVIDHFTYVMAGDGDMQEGISHETCSLAGHLKLGKLILMYDSNQITIDGDADLSFSDDTARRFESYNWHVQIIDGHDFEQISEAIHAAKNHTGRPSLIICKTTIGFGSPNKAGSADSHGAPLGAEEAILTKKNLNIPLEDFHVSAEAKQLSKEFTERGNSLEAKWKVSFEDYTNTYAIEAEALSNAIKGNIPEMNYPEFEEGNVATRSASGKVIDMLASAIPSFFGGSADLTPSNKTKSSGQTVYNAMNRTGTYIHYGVREFAMASIMNGMALHGGILPYGGTFFIFSDYMRSAIRMSALMNLKVIYVFTHDSIGVGEDGPTHQPIEQLTSLRAIPNLLNIRPMDANETAIAWKVALEQNDGPTCLVLTRQNIPNPDRLKNGYASASKLERGGYILTEDENFDLLLIGSGSEVSTILDAKERLNDQGIKCRVVSMPSTELFDSQDKPYRDKILPPDKLKRVAVEAGSSQSWYKYVGVDGRIVGIDRFGASAPHNVLFEKFGFTAEHVVETALALFE